MAEILSPSTALKDRNAKYQLYEQEKVKYYLIIDADTELVEIYELINGQYKLQPFSNQFVFELQSTCSIGVELSGIFS